jgi:hypothetical protein
MVPQPPKPQANSARPIRAKRREPMDIGRPSQLYAKNIAGDFPVRAVCLRRFIAGVSIFEGGIFQQGKRCLLPDQDVRYQNTVYGGKAGEEGPASP